MSHNIFLVGLMGSGKTTVGRALAKRLGLRFIDSDHEIEARTGVRIPVIFDIEGEASFRQREADVIRELTAQKGIVLATGGGAVLNADSRRYLHERGTVIYLHTDIQHIVNRTRYDKNRPLLQTADPRTKLEELQRQREPLYKEAAHLIVETGKPSVHFLVQSIIQQLSQQFGVIPELNSPASSPAMLQVDLGERSYPIGVGAGLLQDREMLARVFPAARIAIVSNTTVAPLYGYALRTILQDLGKQVELIILPDGEIYKDWVHLMQIFDGLLQAQCDRKTMLAALGGGVIGDMTGFAAASYMRGVPFVQLPTTLLSQVDSSVGGKTGINHPLGKNMIGAFYQPQAVLADTSTLQTLPDRELSAGLAEVIKHGAILDAEFFSWLERNMTALRARDTAALTHAIVRSCEIKAQVVKQDERESDLRAILNFGHTFAHAIESGLGYGAWLHGEAVGCGMVMAADLSQRLGYLDAGAVERLRNLVRAAGLPVRAPDLGEARWLELMAVDKKNEAGKIKFILLKPLGQAVITDAPPDLLLQCLQASIT